MQIYSFLLNKKIHVINFWVIAVLVLPACGAQNALTVQLPKVEKAKKEYEYILGPADIIDIFVWRNTDLTITDVPIRPDGKISVPLVNELVAAGKTPKQLARDVEKQLSRYIKDPFVTVIVRQFVGRMEDQIRVVGEVTTPGALPYRKSMTVLDVMITVGGLTEFAAGDRATIVRTIEGKQYQIPVYLESLLKDGDISANKTVYPGDIIIVPESWF